ncbi:MAG: ferrochelatase [Zoogloeaceae bacterium]|jgi:ferrochelatase|nr:ferrochelatase [Zoogloeaceae bacterium]
MPRYLPEPDSSVVEHVETGVLLVNLGSPAAPTPRAVRAYLREFLSDPRVVETPRALWLPILHGVILNTRPRVSAAKYASIWTPEGAPLVVHTREQARYLRGYLGERGMASIRVGWAMRYGKPGIREGLTRLKAAGARRVLVVPLYPQYAASTTASAMDAVCDWLRQTRNQPEMLLLRDFHDDPGYIAALADNVRRHRGPAPGNAVLVFSFHGLPQKSRILGDPYFDQCQTTARLLAEALRLAAHEYRVAFQSRLGKEPWLQPYTAETLVSLARQGVRRVDIVCPGFVADCLETLEEIALSNRRLFLEAGGQYFRYIPALNESPAWLAALADLVEKRIRRGKD